MSVNKEFIVVIAELGVLFETKIPQTEEDVDFLRELEIGVSKVIQDESCSSLLLLTSFGENPSLKNIDKHDKIYLFFKERKNIGILDDLDIASNKIFQRVGEMASGSENMNEKEKIRAEMEEHVNSLKALELFHKNHQEKQKESILRHIRKTEFVLKDCREKILVELPRLLKESVESNMATQRFVTKLHKYDFPVLSELLEERVETGRVLFNNLSKNETSHSWKLESQVEDNDSSKIESSRKIIISHTDFVSRTQRLISEGLSYKDEVLQFQENESVKKLQFISFLFSPTDNISDPAQVGKELWSQERMIDKIKKSKMLLGIFRPKIEKYFPSLLYRQNEKKRNEEINQKFQIGQNDEEEEYEESEFSEEEEDVNELYELERRNEEMRERILELECEKMKMVEKQCEQIDYLKELAKKSISRMHNQLRRSFRKNKKLHRKNESLKSTVRKLKDHIKKIESSTTTTRNTKKQEEEKDHNIKNKSEDEDLHEEEEEGEHHEEEEEIVFMKDPFELEVLKNWDTNRLSQSVILTSDYNSRLSNELEMKKKESAVSIKQVQLEKKEDKLRSQEEELKRRAESLKLFEEELVAKSKKLAEQPIESLKKKVDQKTEETRKELRKRRRNRRMKKKTKKKKIIIKKKIKRKSSTTSKKKGSGRPTREDTSIGRPGEGKVEEEEEGEEDESPFNLVPLVEEFIQIDSEFSDIDKKHFSVALQSGNYEKNRYGDVVPYNHNVIMIKGKESRYVNASDCKINGISYIACQWPLNNETISTEYEYWSMIYYNKVRVIVCLQEPNPPTHHFYWPHRNNFQKLKKYTIQGVDIVRGEDYDIYKCMLGKKLIRKKIMRNLSLRQRGKKKKYLHVVFIFVYKKWPDHGIPESYSSLYKMMMACDKINRERISRKNQEEEEKEPPMLVHCSAGIGRTGVFILCHSLIRNGMGTKDVSETLYDMRKQRNGMIQTPLQYKFSYDFVWKYSSKNKR